MLIIGMLFWIGVSLAVQYLWENQGHKSKTALIVSLIFSPIVGFLVVLLTKEDKEGAKQWKLKGGELKQCPYCAELIKSEAKVCRYCTREL